MENNNTNSVSAKVLQEALTVAKNRGEGVNWSAFERRILNALEEEHGIKFRNERLARKTIEATR
jgi:hypothetical protein